MTLRKILLLSTNYLLSVFIYFYIIPSVFNFSPNYTENYIFSSLYILFFICCIYFFFNKDFKKIFTEDISPIRFEEAFAFFLVLLFTFFSLNYYLPISSALFKDLPFLVMDPRYVLVKFIEIIYQQMLALLLIVNLYKEDRNIRKVQIIFILVFSIIHLLLAFILPIIWVFIFALGSVLAGIIFPWQILKHKNGYFLSLMTHWVFYLLIFLIYRLLN
jgi:hypothetical protein